LTRVRGELPAGTVVRLTLPVGARFVEPHRRIDAVRGCLAVERGPLVLCAESIDLPDGASVDDLRINPAGGLAPAATGAELTGQIDGPGDAGTWPYEDPPGSGRPVEDGQPDLGGAAVSDPPAPVGSTAQTIALIPYYAWGERGPSTMRVWLPKAD
jgi:DUF1680 family protein